MLYSYAYQKNVFTKEQSAELLDIAKRCPSSTIGDYPAPGKNVKVLPAERYQFGEKLDFFFEIVEMKNRELWEFNTYPISKHSAVFFNFYSGNRNEYKFHFDGNTSTARSDIKLTAIVNISQEQYEGGAFELYFGDTVETIDEMNVPGNMIVFPSFIYHRVAPVTMGERISMSYWFKGPSWK